MKTIHGKGRLNNGTCQWLALVNDDATSCTDPNRIVIRAPAVLDPSEQAIWLQGFTAAVKFFVSRDVMSSVVIQTPPIRAHQIDGCPNP